MGGKPWKTHKTEKQFRITPISMEWHPKNFSSAYFEDSTQKSAIYPYP